MKFKEILIKNSKKVVGAAILLSLISAQPVAAAGTVESSIKSNGNIEYDKDNDGTADVFFHANDLNNIGKGMDILNTDNVTLTNKYNDLSLSNSNLKKDYDDLQLNVNKLSEEYDSLIEQVNTNRTNLINASNSTIRANNKLSADTKYADLIKAISGVKTKAAATYTPGTKNQIISADQYLLGNQTVLGDADLVAGNVRAGVILFNNTQGEIKGTFSADATANEGEILSGKTAYKNGNKLTGTMPNNGAWTSTNVKANATTTKNVTIPAGYHNGSGYVQLASLKDQTLGTATADSMIAGKTAWVNGVQLTGTMSNNGAWTSTNVKANATTTKNVTIPAGYHNGSGYVQLASLKDQTPGTAAAGTIVSGKTAWINGVQVTGTFAAQEKTITSSRSTQTVTPDSGKYLSKVTVNALVPTGTYKPTARVNNNDMGATSNYRYVDTTAVPNNNTDTYTFPANDTGAQKDLGQTNTYRYVNATNVYNKGKADGVNETKKGNATAAQVLAGQYFTSLSAGVNVKGTMPNNGAWTSTNVKANATTTKNVTIPAGYHNGSGYVQLASLKDQTPGTATADSMIAGKTAWVNGVQITGTLTTPTTARTVAYTGTGNYHVGTNGTISTGSAYYLGMGEGIQFSKGFYANDFTVYNDVADKGSDMYNKGVQDADNRLNYNSVSYAQGKNDGINSVKQSFGTVMVHILNGGHSLHITGPGYERNGDITDGILYITINADGTANIRDDGIGNY